MTLYKTQQYGIALYIFGAFTGLLTGTVDKTNTIEANAILVLISLLTITIAFVAIKNHDKVISSLGGQ